jgi:enamidase
VYDQTFAPETFGPTTGSLEIRNLTGVVTGLLGAPLREVESIRIENGAIVSMGGPINDADVVLDGAGAIAIPGLCDQHVHLVLGDFSPRQNVLGFVESYMHGGVTFMMSACEVHLPGRPVDPDGVTALAITAHKSWERFRPGGVKAFGGSLICEPGLTYDHLVAARRAGVWLMKVGFGAFTRPADAAPIVAVARDLGYVVMCHSGGASIPGSAAINASDLIAIDPHIAGHINGGTTSLSIEDVHRIIDDTEMDLQIVQAGNLSSSISVVQRAREVGALHRITIGTDTPSGSGVMPLGVLKTLAELCSLANVDPCDAVAFASGNCGRSMKREEGVLAVGRPGDVVLLQQPMGCTAPDALSAMKQGDIPAVAAVVIEGQVRALTSRNTPMTSSRATVAGWISR